MLDRYLTEGGFPDVQNRLNEDRIETDAGPIDVVPAWKWFFAIGADRTQRMRESA